MIILLGSLNPSKKKALELALDQLKISDYKIFPYDVLSGVNDRPIGYEIISGADNRNQHLRQLSIEQDIEYDYLCSIEGGYSIDESGLPFVVSYCIVEDKFGKKSTGKSLGLRLTKKMFEYIKEGGSLNKLIEEISSNSNNKQNGGITGYLSNDLFSREKVDKDAVISGFISFLYSQQKELLDNKIEEKKV